jgi:hypothetical protein
MCFKKIANTINVGRVKIFSENFSAETEIHKTGTWQSRSWSKVLV